MSASRFLVTGASGQLGRLVIDGLLESVPPAQIGVLVRSEKAAAEFAARGLHVHTGDYGRPDSLKAAFTGVDRALLISSSEIGQRTAQHRNAIEAARQAGVKLLAYTSLLHADTSPLGLAEEHRQTEAALKASGVPHALLRNGWYSENYAASIPAALAHGALLGSADGGRIASAARADYAEAAVRVLTAAEPQAGRIYELAGDPAYTLAEFAAELSKQSGKPVAYRDLPQADYEAALVGAGLPGPFAALLADSDAGAAKGALFDDSHTLSQLIGRPTTPIAATISAALTA
ncbi:SDR family oxidoreductase [Rhodopseudomonas sp. G2_2311]|uniref:SDR family oxidoreductase n=1 Tax=Rhodopseudomonas sp. G2_2311 TaxID=3114287 RepID=UPI0039C5ABAE